MNLTRVKKLLSGPRWRACRRMFTAPLRAHLNLAFMHKRPFQVTHRNGQTLTFSRRQGDHRFWDWLLNSSGRDVQFTPEGEILLDHDGLRVALRPGTQDFYVFEEIFLRDCYGIRSLPQRLGTVVDLGGNVGMFSLALLRRSERLVTVEAVESNFRQAQRNLSNNGGVTSDLHRYAVTGKSGEVVVMRLAAHRTGQNSCHSDWMGPEVVCAEERVATISLPDLLARANVAEVDLLKCDVEGAEYDILLSTPRSFLQRIRRLRLEVHFLNDEIIATTLPRLLAHLQDSGFRFQQLATSTPRIGDGELLFAER